MARKVKRSAAFRANSYVFHRIGGKGNKIPYNSYNRGVEEITLSEERENGGFVAYLYNALLPEAMAEGGAGELAYDGDRASIRLRAPLSVCLPRRERRLLIAALIAADYEGDAAYVRRKVRVTDAWAVDGFWNFRLGALKEKWDRIVRYVPATFAAPDLKKFCSFLAGESANKIYLKGNVVYGSDFAPLRRSRLTGREDVETEIILSDAGFIYCLGEVDDSVGDFLQKYYAERAIFS